MTWTPIFDEQPSYSIGEITLDPSNPHVVWVGTGENVSGRHVAWGDGVYRSRDGGSSWQGFTEGLPDDCYANVLRGALAVDGRDPCGVYFGTTSGSVYGSRDRGESWSRLAVDLPKVLSVAAFGR